MKHFIGVCERYEERNKRGKIGYIRRWKVYKTGEDKDTQKNGG